MTSGALTSPQLSVGIMSADLLRLGDELDRLEQAGVNLLHVDVMDGVFCPQITAGPPLVAAIPEGFVIDVHLMIVDPLEKVDAYVEAGADIITFHVESTAHSHRVLQKLTQHGVTRGIALNPGTPVQAVEPLLDEVDLVLLLAVNPGWPGQQFIDTTRNRLSAVSELIGPRSVRVGIDGGVTLDNAAAIGKLQPDLVVAGSAIFGADDLGEATARLRRDLGIPRPAHTVTR
jgi:ribulose-phosphate 3-epimerase